jgi:L-2-hydroxycarboxylate dehydrogenase (NAD+)
VIDWATSAIASGRVQQCAREGKPLPPEAALDAEGNYTTDPARVAALVPMGGRLAGHKGWGLALIDELYAAYIGGSLPTIRGLAEAAGRKGTSAFFFQAIHPDAIAPAGFASPRDQHANVKAVLSDIRGHGNEKALLPGELEARAAAESAKAGGLIFTAAEVAELKQFLSEAGITDLPATPLAT